MKEVNVKFYDVKPGHSMPADVYRVPAHPNADWEKAKDWHWVYASTVPQGVYFVPRGAEGDVAGPCGTEPSAPRWVKENEFPNDGVPVWDVGGRRCVGDGMHQGGWVSRPKAAR